MDFIDLKTQYSKIADRIDQRIKKVLQEGKYILGPEVTELEEKLAAIVGVKHCIGVSSGTDALQIALMALNVGPGDEVITSPFSFFSSAAVIIAQGATPVFVDIDLQTYNLNPEILQEAITERTKVIMPVSLNGQCADMDAINQIAAEFGIAVIEDAAQSFGATYKNRRSCGLSTIGCTSFYPSKPLGCYGDGGACFTDDDALATSIKELRVHGQESRYYHTRIGMNGRLDTLQAAILLEKLSIFKDEILARQFVAAQYTEILKDRVTTPYIAPHNSCVYAQYTIQVEDRDEIQKQLTEAGIPTAVHYPKALHFQPAIEAEKYVGNLPVAEALMKRVLSLPMHPYLTPEQIQKITEALLATNY